MLLLGQPDSRCMLKTELLSLGNAGSPLLNTLNRHPGITIVPWKHQEAGSDGANDSGSTLDLSIDVADHRLLGEELEATSLSLGIRNGIGISKGLVKVGELLNLYLAEVSLNMPSILNKSAPDRDRAVLRMPA